MSIWKRKKISKFELILISFIKYEDVGMDFVKEEGLSNFYVQIPNKTTFNALKKITAWNWNEKSCVSRTIDSYSSQTDY